MHDCPIIVTGNEVSGEYNSQKNPQPLTKEINIFIMSLSENILSWR